MAVKTKHQQIFKLSKVFTKEESSSGKCASIGVFALTFYVFSPPAWPPRDTRLSRGHVTHPREKALKDLW